MTQRYARIQYELPASHYSHLVWLEESKESNPKIFCIGEQIFKNFDNKLNILCNYKEAWNSLDHEQLHKLHESGEISLAKLNSKV